MVPIADVNIYTSGMQKSMEDKLWFLDIPDIVRDIEQRRITSVYDFGCADGALLSAVNNRYSNLKLLGFDPSEDMLKLAYRRPWSFANTPLKRCRSGTILVASSVFHEIHAYRTEEEITQDYNSIFETGADYIAIRDMFVSENIPVYAHDEYVRMVRDKANYTILREFECTYGSIDYSRNLIHFLLKYRYEENWDRELKENYLPHTLQGFMNKIPEKYKIVYSEHVVLPFLQDRIREDFGFTLRYPTHGKILLSRCHD